MNFNIWKYHSKKQIRQFFDELNKNIYLNNSSYFHYTEYELSEYSKNPDLDKKQRFQNFYILWHNFENKKRILDRFFAKNKVTYPAIFEKQNRHIIKKFLVDYTLIMDEINNYKAIKKQPPYSYIILIKKLIKLILLRETFKNQTIDIIDINIQENLIEVHLNLNKKTDKWKIYKYKLNKFLKKYQQLYPAKYKYCKAYLVISSNWKDLLLQSTFKQWTSCVNLLNDPADYSIMYSSTNGVKAGNLIAYAILDLDDNKSIDQIMDDNGYNGLMYNRCFWRCSIKRYVNKNNFHDYLFCAQNTSYGTILQNAISYHCNLFILLNKWLTKLNQSLNITFQQNQYYKIYKLPYNLYSDIHSYSLETADCKIYLFNTEYIKSKLACIALKDIRKLSKLVLKNKFLLTNDIVAFLKMFKHFDFNEVAKEYLIKNNSMESYVLEKYFSGLTHYWIANTHDAQRLINNFKRKHKDIVL